MIVCEIGLNHLGDADYANQYVDHILNSPADALTFQVREKSFYDNPRFTGFSLGEDFYSTVSERVRKGGRKFGIALADRDAVDFFAGLQVDFYKVLSRDIENYSLLDELLSKTTVPIFVSTGMSDIKQMDEFVKRINHAKDRVRLIHTQLSSNIDDVNLGAIPFLRERYSLSVAFGLHCRNRNVLYLAVAFAPSDIFFYVRGDRPVAHPDEEHAIPCKDIVDVVQNLKEVSRALGSPIKLKMDNEIERERD